MQLHRERNHGQLLIEPALVQLARVTWVIKTVRYAGFIQALPVAPKIVKNLHKPACQKEKLILNSLVSKLHLSKLKK